VTASASSPAHADVVWPALFLEERLLSLPAIIVGLIVEVVVLKLLFALRWRLAGWYALAVNTISAAIGLVLLPIAGLAWEVGPGQLANQLTGMGTFNPVTWAATMVLAVAISTGIEGLCLIEFFKLRFNWSRWLLWGAANMVSVGIAIYSVATVPPQP